MATKQVVFLQRPATWNSAAQTPEVSKTVALGADRTLSPCALRSLQMVTADKEVSLKMETDPCMKGGETCQPSGSRNQF